MDEIDNLLEKYVERFEEKEIRKLLEESLETGKPFRPELDPDKIY